jgi:hypothetical protein
MILFDDVGEGLDLPAFDCLRQYSAAFELGNGFGRGRILLESDDAGS